MSSTIQISIEVMRNNIKYFNIHSLKLIVKFLYNFIYYRKLSKYNNHILLLNKRYYIKQRITFINNINCKYFSYNLVFSYYCVDFLIIFIYLK